VMLAMRWLSCEAPCHMIAMQSMQSSPPSHAADGLPRTAWIVAL
jgi:hypothetical protein